MRATSKSAAGLHSTADTEFEASISFLITALGNRLALAAERTIRKAMDLSLMEWRVLCVLAVEPAAAPGRIISIAGVNKAAVSRAVNSLEKRGLLYRRAAPDHGLRTNLFLTRAGHAMYDRGNIERDKGESLLMRGLSASDRRRLTDLLKHLMRTVDDLESLRRP